MGKSKKNISVEVKIEQSWSQKDIKRFGKELREDVMKSTVGSKEFKELINKTLKQANKRSYDLEKANLPSSANEVLKAEGRTGYGKFKIGRGKITDEFDWHMMKSEYARAVAFLNEPTSSKTGVKHHIESLAKSYDIDNETVTNFLWQSLQKKFVQYGDKYGIALLDYKNVFDNFMKGVGKTKNSMDKNSKEYEKQLEANIQEELSKVDTIINKTEKKLNNSFKNGIIID